MSLKMKSFKKSIFNADMRQLWVLMLIYGAIIFFGTFFDFYLDKSTYGNAVPYNFVNSRFFQYNCISNFFGFVAGAVLALRLYSYLYSTSAISFYHGLPFKRRSIFISKLLSGIVLLAIPVLVNFAIIAITKLCGSDIQIRWYSLFYWFGNQMIYSILAFSFVTFAVMLSGNVLSLLVTCLLLCIAPAVIIGFAHTVCQNFLWGYAYNPENFITFFYITPDVLLFKLRGLVYLAAIPAFLIISYFMYKKRDLERCGEAVVFPKLKVVFTYFAGLLGGIFSYFYFSIWNFKSLLFMLPFGISAIIIANMVNRRGITLKGALKHSLIFTAFVLILMGCFHFDIIGFETRIPENIENVTVMFDRYTANSLNTDIAKYEITDKNDIEKVTAYHRYNIDRAHSEDTLPSYIELNYTLENGRTLKRAYNVDFIGDKAQFEEISEFEQIKKLLYPIYKAEDLKIVNVELNNFLGSSIFYPNGKDTQKLLAAIREDIENIEYDENAALYWNSMDCDTPLYVSIEYKSPLPDRIYNENMYFPISFGFTKTMALLKEWGEYDRLMTVRNITAVGIDRDGDNKGEFRLKDYNVDEIITEREKMQEILTTLQTAYKNPTFYSDDREYIYDEYIFLDNSDTAHTFSLLKKYPKRSR